MFVVIGILIGLIVGTVAALITVRLLGSTSLGAAQRSRRLLIEQAERDADGQQAAGVPERQRERDERERRRDQDERDQPDGPPERDPVEAVGDGVPPGERRGDR